MPRITRLLTNSTRSQPRGVCCGFFAAPWLSGKGLATLTAHGQWVSRSSACGAVSTARAHPFEFAFGVEFMKSRDTLVRLKRFQAEEKRRRVAQIEAMIGEFSRMASDLDREIAGEEQRTGVGDTSHFAYSTYARAARARRDNLHNSVEELRGQLAEAKDRFEEANAELAKVQVMDVRERGADVARERAETSVSISLRTA